jgi:hypothetical protein
MSMFMEFLTSERDMLIIYCLDPIRVLISQAFGFQKCFEDVQVYPDSEI